MIFTQAGLSHAEWAGVFTTTRARVPVCPCARAGWRGRPDAGDARFDELSGRADSAADNLG